MDLTRALVLAALVCCVHGVTLCEPETELVVRDIFEGLASTKGLVALHNELYFNDTAVRARTASLTSAVYAISHEAYTNVEGIYDVALFSSSPYFDLDRDYMMNLTHLWNKHPDWEVVVPEHMKVQCVAAEGGHYIAAPIFTDGPYVLWYNESRLATWGVSLPTTFDEILEICDDLQGRGITEGCLRMPGWISRYDEMYMFDVVDTRLHGHEYHQEMLDMETSFLDPRFAETLAYLQSLVDRGYLMPNRDINWGLKPFLDGKLPFMITAPLMIDMVGRVGYTQEQVKSELRVIKVPPIRPGVISGEAFIHTFYGIPQNARHVAEAERFIELMMSPEGQNAYFSETGVQSGSGFYNVTDPIRLKLREITTNAHTTFRIVHNALQPDVAGELSWQLAQWVESDGDPAVLDALPTVMEQARQAQLFTKVAPIVSDPANGDFVDRVEITLSTETVGATIYYTLDGSVPFLGSLVYESPIVLTTEGTHVIRAFGVLDGFVQSDYFQSSFVLTKTALPSSSTSGLSSAQLGGVIGGSVSALVCLVAVVGIVLFRKIRSRKVSYTLGGDAPLMVDYNALEVVRLVGMGAFGEVFLARWRGSDVAVKRMLSLEMTESLMEAFVSEASMVMHLRHRNIVTFMGICTEPLCIVTEFMHRGSLYDVIHNDAVTLDPSICFQWARDIATGMEFLHSATPPVLHRDFKSLNVLLDRNWVPKIADFGLSAVKDAAAGYTPAWSKNKKKKKKKKKKMQSGMGMAPHISQSSMLSSFVSEEDSMSASNISTLSTEVSGGIGDDAQGTLYWTAPEVLANPQAVVAKSDVYAYGITLWEMLSRAELYDGGNQFAVAMAVLREKRRPPLDEIPPSANALIPLMQRCWSHASADRPTFAEIVQEIDNGHYYNPEQVVLPTIQSEPSGRVIILCIHFPDVQEGMNECPQTFARALMRAHETVETLIEKHGAYTWAVDPENICLSFQSLPRVIIFVNDLVHSYQQIDWDDDILESLVGAPIMNVDGEQVMAGVRFTAAATICEPQVERNIATTSAIYTGPEVNAVIDEARTHTFYQGVAICPTLAEEASRSIRSEHTLSTTLSEISRWTVIRDAISFDLDPSAHRFLHLEDVYTEQQESFSEASDSLSCTESSSDAPAAPRARGNKRNSMYSSGRAARSGRDSARSLKGKGKGKGKGSSQRRGSSNPVPGGRMSLADGIDARRANRANTWIIQPDEIRAVWDSFERFKVGSFTESVIGTFRGRKVLFKRLLRQTVPMEGQIQFLLEVAEIRQLRHTNLLPCLGGCFVDKNRLMVIPYCPAGNLADLLCLEGSEGSSRRKLPLSSRARIAQQICDGIEYLHSQGVTFGSIKPTNVLLGEDNTVFLTDYGLEKQKNLGTATQTSSATYEAPECLRGEPRSPTSDVFSLGTILFELLSWTAFPRGRNSMETAMRLLTGILPDMPDSMPRVGAHIVQSCWKPNPDERPTIDRVKRDLRSLS